MGGAGTIFVPVCSRWKGFWRLFPANCEHLCHSRHVGIYVSLEVFKLEKGTKPAQHPNILRRALNSQARPLTGTSTGTGRCPTAGPNNRQR